MESIRVIVADDSDLMITGVRSLIEKDYRFRVVGLARCTDSLVDVVRHRQPQIVLWGAGFHHSDTLTTIEQLRTIAPDAKRLMVGSLTDGILIRDLMRLGLDGYLHKGDDLTLCLLDALVAMSNGKVYLSTTARSAYRTAVECDNRAKPSPLTAEMRDVLRLLAAGLSVHEIANKLGIGKKRVYRLRSRLKSRFDAKTNEHLIQRAVSEGFVTPVSSS
ncbi:MAG: DNA-binding response regulator [Anaerolineaceae bacterium]|nr:MAG: DNA-binding response regulator [Anaerolineaceae bacterium]